MDGQTYQIKLNINVDDSQLSKAERRIGFFRSFAETAQTREESSPPESRKPSGASGTSKEDPVAVDNGEMGVVRGVETILTSLPADAHITGR